MAKKDRNPPSAVAQHGPGGNIAQASLLSAQVTRTESRALPVAEELQAYRDMDSDLYDIIKREFDANGPHRRHMEKLAAQDRNTLVRSAGRNDTLGLLASWSFAVLCLGVGSYFISRGQEVGAVLGMLGLLPPIIGAFRIRRTPNEKQ